ncbi:hypothetical protein ACGF12_26915 [Kitasatospora sp. NPDC048296]|uniref:hypothetical protein n=1 Tax=Kitasatospora sp. NPDC048296 TaxID=3364048 RepID=UPI00370F95AD
MRRRTLAVAAAGIGAAALATTGITYALAGFTSAPPSVQQVVQPVEQVDPEPLSVQRAAQPVQQAAPAAAVAGGGGQNGGQNGAEKGGAEKDGGEKGGAEKDGGENGEKREGGDRHEGGRGRGHGHEEAGRIYFNERTYSADSEGCITAASGLGSTSFSVFNDSRKVVEVYRGFSCDGGSPVTTVGPYGATNGVVTRTTHGSMFGGDGAVGSFRVIGDYDEW